MIPILLTIKGLYSYRKEQKIDFKKLISAQLFGIFGGVGSGKSSIIEAISFALYEQSERLNARDKRNYNMMNLKSDEFLIDFVFSAGKEEQEYRIKIETTRKKNKDEVNPFSRQTYKLESGKWVATELNIEEIVGLSYENFKRTIIIPQGKFQDFLELKESERVKMMKEIFQLERFDLSDKVSSLISANKLKIENLQGQLTGLSEVSEEIIQQKESEEKTGKEKLGTLSAKLQQAKNELSKLEKIKELFQQLEEKETVLEKLKSKESKVNEQEFSVKRYQRYDRVFRNDLKNQANLNLKKADVSMAIEKNASEAKVTAVQLSEQETVFRKISDEFKERDKLLRMAEEMEVYLEIRKLSESLSTKKADEHGVSSKVSELEKAFQVLADRETELQGKLSQLKGDRPDQGVLYEIKSWFDKQKNLDKILLNLKEEISLNKETEKKILEKLKALLTTAGYEASDNPDFTSFSENLDAQTEEKRQVIDSRKTELERCITHQKLEEYASELEDGKPCPLCGSEHHPEVMIAGSMGDKASILRQEIGDLEQGIRTIQDLKLEAQGIFHSLESEKVRRQENEVKLTQAKKDNDDLKNAFTWKGFENFSEDEIIDLLNKSRELETREKQLSEEMEAIRNQQKGQQSQKESLQARLQEIRQSVSSLDSKIDTLKHSLKTLKIEKAASMSEQDLKLKAEGLRQKYQVLGNEYERIESEINGLRLKVGNLEGEKKSLLKREQEIFSDLEKLESSIQDSLQAESVKLEEVESTLGQKLDVDRIEKEVSEFRKEFHAVQQSILEIRKQSEGLQFSHEQFSSLKSEVETLEGEHEKSNEVLIRLKKEIQDLKAMLERKIQLDAELQKLNIRADNLKVLSNLFRSSGFVNYISSRYLVNLCNAANDKFYKLTRQRLRLEISENNDFQVRDYLNNGKVRSVKTLSGGQTFQASLCLALALADSIQQQNKSKQNFFFLDEGFGSQDKDSLMLVFEALKSLRKENRVVGVISHVEELQQEINVFLKVKNTEEEGSLIEL